jgi:hypothetical protein
VAGGQQILPEFITGEAGVGRQQGAFRQVGQELSQVLALAGGTRSAPPGPGQTGTDVPQRGEPDAGRIRLLAIHPSPPTLPPSTREVDAQGLLIGGRPGNFNPRSVHAEHQIARDSIRIRQPFAQATLERRDHRQQQGRRVPAEQLHKRLIADRQFGLPVAGTRDSLSRGEEPVRQRRFLAPRPDQRGPYQRRRRPPAMATKSQ